MSLKYLFNPHWFNKCTNKILKPLVYCQFLLLALGLYYALFKSPPDYQQEEIVRIMYLHVPAACFSLLLYALLAVMSFINLVFRIRLALFIAMASAEVGMCCSIITIITGSLWGRPIWGAWWVWDVRLTSMLILSLLYLVYLAIVYSGEPSHRIEKPAGVIAMIGFINIPIIKFSVNLWASLHQSTSLLRLGAIHPAMLKPLCYMGLALGNYVLLMIILKVQRLIKKYQQAAKNIKQLL